ncbi:hypothetical protein NHX12_029897 [Muraenolepis orangiensis]|uniref:Uncharacterized protein n=1 Tax=Muraenolepis orangiensis TaxID=630683 RepID=A0A9Q0E957_9TELE|nr:hypothetical protein NHX12_029897 [Muraenolepis orangiensis]
MKASPEDKRDVSESEGKRSPAYQTGGPENLIPLSPPATDVLTAASVRRIRGEGGRPCCRAAGPDVFFRPTAALCPISPGTANWGHSTGTIEFELLVLLNNG